MGCKELDIRDYYQFAEPSKKSHSHAQSCTKKTPYSRFSHTVISNYRYYSAELGRWLSRDPIGENGGYNVYAMVGNDGVGRWDWLGLSEFRAANNPKVSYVIKDNKSGYIIFKGYIARYRTLVFPAPGVDGVFFDQKYTQEVIDSVRYQGIVSFKCHCKVNSQKEKVAAVEVGQSDFDEADNVDDLDQNISIPLLKLPYATKVSAKFVGDHRLYYSSKSVTYRDGGSKMTADITHTATWVKNTKWGSTLSWIGLSTTLPKKTIATNKISSLTGLAKVSSDLDGNNNPYLVDYGTEDQKQAWEKEKEEKRRAFEWLMMSPEEQAAAIVRRQQQQR